MPSWKRVENLREALSERRFPTVTIWNRLEGRPRTQSFERAIKAEVRDPLWMLTRQWQFGEYGGSDAGSPVSAKVRIDTTRLTKYRPGEGPTEPFGYDVPLEGEVERRPLRLRSRDLAVALDLRLAMGRQWLALIEGIADYRQAFIDAYPIAEPDPDDPDDSEICAHPQVWETYAAVAGHAMDGGALLEHLRESPGNHAYDGVAGIDPNHHDELDTAAGQFVAWFERLILQPPPSGDDAWSPPQLEYRFAASAPLPDGGEKVYVAEEYAQGRLDWYSVDVAAGAEPLDPVPGSEVTDLPPEDARTMIPVPVSFAGMPSTRWWAFEEGRTNFGDIDASTTDLAKLLFLEFALVFANDWFVIPYTLPAGSIASVRGVAVTNVFGERLWVEPAGAGADEDWQRWSMFEVNVAGTPDAAADTSLLLLPTVAKMDEGPPVEDVALIRDEVANMVWGVETTVPLADGGTSPGLEAAQQLRALYEARLGVGTAEPVPPAAPIRYRVMSTVPENWIPFVPVHVEGSNREIQLQRAAMPRILEGDPEPPVKVRPRTSLLREGLDRSPAEAYFLHEEEVPRAGARVFQAFQRTRWTNGRVHVWLGARRQTGRGEGASGLRFDYLADVTPPSEP